MSAQQALAAQEPISITKQGVAESVDTHGKTRFPNQLTRRETERTAATRAAIDQKLL
jgi:hypothetical protein